MNSKQPYFPKRIPEPKTMAREEMLAFRKMSVTNFNRWVLPIIFNVKNHVTQKRGQAKILDAGCGPGLMTKGLAESFPQASVVGCDSSKYAVNLAKKACAGLKNVTILQEKLENFHYPKNSFDLIICKDTLHHFLNARLAISTMFGLLKSGGRLYIQDLRRDMPFRLLQECLKKNTPEEKLRYYSARAAYTETEIRQMLKSIDIKKFKIYSHKANSKTGKYLQGLGVSKLLISKAFDSRLIVEAWK